MKPLHLFLFLTLMLGSAVGFNVYKQNQTLPENFARTFSATGLVEAIESKGSRCTVKVAVYDWLNLSKDFPLAEIPEQNDRFYVVGEGDTCNALKVATASTSDHIAFIAGNARGGWYFTEAPLPGAGCGGLALGWKPEPEILN